jgi:hypothetical protein
MSAKLSKREKCSIGRHTPRALQTPAGDVRHDVCRYCRRPIMRTQATRIWFLATMLA